MHAQVGDRLVVEGRTVGDPRREAVVLEVRGEDGGPPYLVEWNDVGEALFYPGPDAHVQPQS